MPFPCAIVIHSVPFLTCKLKTCRIAKPPLVNSRSIMTPFVCSNIRIAALTQTLTSSSTAQPAGSAPACIICIYIYIYMYYYIYIYMSTIYIYIYIYIYISTPSHPLASAAVQFQASDDKGFDGPHFGGTYAYVHICQ